MMTDSSSINPTMYMKKLGGTGTPRATRPPIDIFKNMAGCRIVRTENIQI